MTRRGSIAYYFAAIVVGCFAATVGFFYFGTLPSFHGSVRSFSVKDFFLMYFLSLPFGAVSAILFGFLLRRLAAVWHLRHALAWMGLGAVLGAGLTLVLGGMMQVVTRAVPGSGVPAGLLPLVLPLVYTFFAQQLMLPIWWVMLPAGALTALVLRAIDRAFEPAGPAPPA